MDVQQDFKELLALFNALHVKYLIVGGYALAFHGAPRMTGDIDIYVQPNDANAAKIIEALKRFGFGDLGLKIEDFNTLNNHHRATVLYLFAFHIKILKVILPLLYLSKHLYR